MSATPPPQKPAAARPAAAKPAAAPAAVIRQVRGAEESSTERLLKKHVPAWVISGAVHVALIGTLIAIDTMMPPVQAAPPPQDELVVVTEEKKEEEKLETLTNPDLGNDAEIPKVLEKEREADANVDRDVVPDAAVGGEMEAAVPTDLVSPPAGVSAGDTGGIMGDAGMFAAGTGGPAGGTGTNGLVGRSGATKNALLKAGGGTGETEAAVARGLIWLAKKQKADGSWQFDGTSADDRPAATGLALLPFLAAGQTHKPSKEKQPYTYQKQVEAGLKYLLSVQEPSGTFKGSSGMYSHAIVTVALCELFGMTTDRQRLLKPAQAAVNYIVAAQATDGSWGYTPNKLGDTSILGWQIQALHSAKLCKDLTVPKAAFEKSRGFLDKVAGPKKETYGYTDRSPKLSLTPVGLLCRYYGDGWGPNNPGMAAGVKYVLDKQTPAAERPYDMYYYYYATQVVHFFDGPEWHQTWNPAMRKLMLDKQAKADNRDAGSWDPDQSLIGSSCGRLGTTCLCLLTLEVYYRHLPLYKRDTAGLRELERNR